MTDFNGFKFSGKALDDEDLPRLGHKIGVGEDIIHANIEVETGGNWVDAQGRLPMLYEPHKAWEYSAGDVRKKLEAAGLAYPEWGTKPYPKDSYPRLLKAIEIAGEEIALRSASWGGPQILGSNYKLAGYASAIEMVLDFQKSAAAQLEGMVNFIKGAGLDDELRALQAKLDKGKKITAADCVPYVRGYNGKGYAKNKYHEKLAASLNKWAKIPDTAWSAETAIPEDIYDGKFHKQIQEVQILLDKKKYPEVGDTDGKYGDKTATAIMAFRRENGLPIGDKIDADFLAALSIAPDRVIPEARANATIQDLRKDDVVEIKQTDQTKLVGQVATVAGGVLGGGKVLDDLQAKSESLRSIYDTVQPFIGFMQDNLWLILGGVGIFVVWKSGVLQKIRLSKHQEGQDVSA